MTNEPLLVTIPEGCRRLGIGRSKIYEHIKSGRIEAVKDGRRTLLTTRSLHVHADSLPAVHQAA